MVKDEFIVRQSILINSLLLVFFLLICLGLVFTYNADRDHTFSLFVKPFAVVMCFVVVALVNIRRRRVIYKVDSTGIFYYGSQVANWNNFYMAYASDDSGPSSINDDMRLVIQFYDSNLQLVEKRLSAPPTLEKGVDEILEAIVRYHPRT